MQNEEIKTGEKFQHYKTKDIYEILNICNLQASKESGLDMEECVSYKKVILKEEDKNKENRIWVRPIKMFLEKVKDENEKEVQRFTKIEN